MMVILVLCGWSNDGQIGILSCVSAGVCERGLRGGEGEDEWGV